MGFSTLSTGFSTIDYVNCKGGKYAKLVDIKLVKHFFTGIFTENLPGEKAGSHCQFGGLMV